MLFHGAMMVTCDTTTTRGTRTDLGLPHESGGIQQHGVDGGGGSGQLVVVEDAEEGVVGQQTHPHLPQ